MTQLHGRPEDIAKSIEALSKIGECWILDSERGKEVWKHIKKKWKFSQSKQKGVINIWRTN